MRVNAAVDATFEVPVCRVVVTRPQPQADAWVARLAALGQPALVLPLLRIDADDGDAPAVREAWQGLAAFELVMFVSPNAVLSFWSHRPPGMQWAPHVAAGATGPGTVAALQQAGVPPEAILAPDTAAARFDAEALWAGALRQRAWAGRSVLVVRGDSGRDWLGDTLRQAGAAVHFLAAYRQHAPTWDAAALGRLDEVLAQPARHAWLFSSSRAIGHLCDQLKARSQAPSQAGPQAPSQMGVPAPAPGGWIEARAMAALATHPRIAEAACAAGFQTVVAVRPQPLEVVSAVRALARHRRHDGT